MHAHIRLAKALAGAVTGPPTYLTTEPPAPSEDELDRRLHTLFGAHFPFNPDGNRFADLYEADGSRIAFQSMDDLSRVIEPDIPRQLLDGFTFRFPCSVELNFQWSIGAPGQELDTHFAFALLNQLLPSNPPQVPLTLPDGTRIEPNLCRSTREGSFRGPVRAPDWNTESARNRAAHQICTMVPFREPRLFRARYDNDEELLERGAPFVAWWEVCTNCIAVRAKNSCTCSKYQTMPARVAGPLRLNPEFQVQKFFDQDLGYYVEKDWWLPKASQNIAW